MSRENRRKALSPRQPLNGQRVLSISRSQQNDVRKDLLRLATVNVHFLSGRSREVGDMFDRRRVDIGAKEPEYTEVRKSTSFGGADQRKAEME